MSRCYTKGCRRELDPHWGGYWYGLCRLCNERRRKRLDREACPCMACQGAGVLPLVALDMPEDPRPFDPEEDRRDEWIEVAGVKL